jgi:DNA primase
MGDDNLLYYTGRAYKKEVLDKYPKYFNSMGMERGALLYGIEKHKSNTLHLVEGQMCVLTLHQLGLYSRAVMGKISDGHIEKIRDSRIKRVFYYMDNDKAGRANAFLVGKKLEEVDIEVIIAIPPKGIKDVNENGGVQNYTYTPFFEWALESIETLKPYTKEKVFKGFAEGRSK